MMGSTADSQERKGQEPGGEGSLGTRSGQKDLRATSLSGDTWGLVEAVT